MRLNKRYLILLMGLLLIQENLYTQDCKAKLFKVYESVRSIDFKSNYYIKYRAEVEYTSGEIKEENVTAYAFNGKNCVESNKYIVYADDSLMISIIEPNKTIFISRNLNNKNQDLRGVFQLQDSLLNSSISITCNNVKEGVKQYVIIPSNGYQQQYKVDSYLINVDSDGKIKDTVFEYSAGPIKRYTIQLIAYFNQNTKIPFEGDIKAIVLDKNQLNKKYSNYRLVDSRELKNRTVNGN